MIISLENVSKNYSGEQVLNNIALSIENTDRIGLIGINGCGKSTLLRIIAGGEFPDTQPEPNPARIFKGKDAKIGFLAQNSGLDGDSSVINVMKSVKRATSELHAIADWEIDKILRGMGFLPETYERVISTLSGGERTRLALARLLLEAPALLILDEPTNHLDFDTVLWLEDYLNDYKSALLIVSHDRYFLDRLVTSVCEIERGTLRRFKGNYTAFVPQKEQLIERQRNEYEAQQLEMAKLKDYIARNLVRASTSKMAQSRVKQLEKLEANPVRKPVTGEKSAYIRFGYEREPPKEVLGVADVNLTVGDSITLAESIRFDVCRGERLAIVGANGSGKSTLLKVLQRKHPHSRGQIEWGENVRISYFEQTNTELFDEGWTVLNAVHRLYPRMTELAVRNLLGGVRLTGDDVYKRVGDLSGGERAKLRFAIMTLERGNVLILDEPTNHLDISSRDVLETALFEFRGTIIFVSHDRYLLNKLATRVLEIGGNKITAYSDFGVYLESRKRSISEVVVSDTPKQQKNTTHRSKEQRAADSQKRVRISKLESEIEQLEQLASELQGDMESPEVFANHELLQEKCRVFEQTKQRLSELTDEWLVASEE
jgi:ATP-binding cassette subfamily F protein 3